MRKYLQIVLLLAFLPICAGAMKGAGHQDFSVRNITMNEGLPTNAVRSIVQDKYGFIWFGTDNGLCRYDGYDVHVFSNPHQKFDQYVSALCASEDGMLVGTIRGVFLFSFRTETFSRLSERITSQVNSMAMDGNGNVWVATKEQGVFRYHIRSRQLKNYPVSGLKDAVSTVFVDSDNQVWALSLTGKSCPWRLNKLNDSFLPFPIKGGVVGLGGKSIVQAPDGSLLIGTWDKGLVQVNSDGTTRQLLDPTTTNMGHHIHSLLYYSDHELFIGCDDGLVCYDLSRHSWRLISECFTPPDMSIAGRFVYGIAKDGEGGIWICTFYGGVSYLSPLRDRFRTYMSGNGVDQLQGSVVGRFAEDRSHHIWVATDDGGLNCYDPVSDRFVDYPGRSVLSRYNVHGLFVEGNSLWVGTYGDGVVRLDIPSGNIKTFHLDGEKDYSSCYCFFRDSEHRLWATSMEGANVFDEQAQAFRFVKSLKSLGVAIVEDTQGNVWFGTQGNGLWCYRDKGMGVSASSGAWKHYMPIEGDTTSVPSNGINCIRLSPSGRLYVVTDQGLCQYMPSTDGFSYIPLNVSVRDFSSIIVYQDEMWISSSKGILRYVPGEGIRMYNRYDGLTTDQFLPNAGLMASDGRIYFGTTRGFNAFYPHQIKVNQVAPPVFICSLELFNRPMSVGTEKLPEALNQIAQLDLRHGDDVFSISFAALSYVSPEKNQYAYKLEGFDKDWIYSGNEHKATYTNIPAGTYVFRVKATNNDGVWSQKEATLKIEVHPPFWWSLPAKVLYLLLIGSVIYFYIQMRLRKERRHHQREMRLLSEKKEQEVRDARLQFFTMIAHEIRTPVSLIIGPLENLKDEWARVSKKVRDASSVTSTLDVIDRNAQRLLNLVNQLLDFNKVQQQGMQMHFRLQNISRLIHAVAERFEPTLKKKGARLEVDYPAEDFAAVIDKEAITKVVSNLMTNATKYTRDYVKLSCRMIGKERFCIQVEDNGIGISADEQDKIFAAFYQARDNKPGTGIGLSIVKNLVKAHHGEVKVESKVGEGSVFTVTLPMMQEDAALGEEENLAGGVDAQVSDIDRMDSNSNDETRAEESLSMPTMLVVEDDEDMRNFIANYFRDTYLVLTAKDGMKGLELLEQNMVDMIVSDWMMPKMDGDELCRRVRRNPETSHIPFVMLTAKTDNDSKAEGMNSGADAYVEKPFSLKYLEACIRNLVEMRRLLQRKYSHTPLEPISHIAPSEIDNELLCKINQLIEDNIDNTELNVVFLADKLGISRSSLFAKIKALVDVTPSEMIKIVKLKKAAQLLKEGKYRINEVCYMVGFSSPSYFTKCFYKQFGMKPFDISSNEESKQEE